ncbi:SusD/RagB family nutrient-binding outer membrane lipoprotein [Chitinophaga sp.]|uniref:SusD/RagB family nutrient-binding outer membrane lipoprotein n=1 Tax=Chitinophaga sp. TaxID=1869181 RepID=UPI0031CFC01B
MKKIIYTVTSAVLMLGIGLSSCTKNFTDINTDPNNAAKATPAQLMAPALVNTLSANLLRNRNFNNELMQVTVDATDAEGKVFRYDFRANWADNLYNNWYSELTNFKEMYKIASEELTINNSYKAISLICQSWIYSMLTDTYGDVPYFYSNMAKDSLLFEPPFDAQKDIYLDIFSKLEQANTWLASSPAIVANGDPVFSGDLAKWRRFGNSLYLRLLMRVSGKAEVSQQCIDKIKQIVTSASTYPIFTKNEESAVLRWTGNGPYVSPLLAVREQDYRAPGIASFFIDNLTSWNDPRIDIPTHGFDGFNRWRIAPSSGAYVGIPSGYAPGANPVKRSYFYSTSSKYTMMSDPMTGILMNYAEVQFILAEATVKGWINTLPADTLYSRGVDASIRYWLPDWKGNVKDYLAAADMEWDEAATLEQKMQRIHLQKYYALLFVDLQQWFEYRRTGYPVLPKGEGLRNNGVMPARMTYPVYVQSTNPTNYKKAVAAQGPDVISTQVWWQKP